MNFTFRTALYLASSYALACAALSADTMVKLDNPGFEDGFNTGWSLWVAPDSLANNCHQELCSENPHSGVACLKLSTDQISRFCIGRKETFTVQAAERYRISVWVRGNAEFAPDSPGFLIRVRLQSQETPGAGAGSIDLLHIDLNGKVTRNAVPATGIAIPAQWTRVSSVIEIPTGTTKMDIGIFFWNATGSIYLDDFSLEKVDASTPLSEMTPPSK